MKKSVQLATELKDLAKRQEELRELLKATVKEETEAAVNDSAAEQNIQRLGKRMIIVHASDLIGCPWNYAFHDWKKAAEYLFEYLEKIAPEKWVDKLEEMYNNRKDKNRVDLTFKCKDFYGYSTHIEPISAKFVEKVIARLKEND